MTAWRVRYAPTFLDQVEASPHFEQVGMSLDRFFAGPVAVARRELATGTTVETDGVRHAYVQDPVLGPVVFFAVAVGELDLEIIGFTTDPDYWDLVGLDPGE